MFKFISLAIALTFGTQAIASPIENWLAALPDETSAVEIVQAVDQMPEQDRQQLIEAVQANPEYPRISRNVQSMLSHGQLKTLEDLKMAAIAGQQTAFLGPILIGGAALVLAVGAWIIHCHNFMKEHPRAPMCMR